MAGTDCDISTKPRVLRASLYISILYESRDRIHKSAKFEISPVWSQMNPGFTIYGLLYTTIIYSSWLYCSDLYSYLTPTNSMEPSPFRQTNSSSGSRDICHMLQNSKVHYHINNRPPSLPVLIQLMQSIFTTLKNLKSHTLDNNSINFML